MKFGFSGEVVPAKCACHKGQFKVEVSVCMTGQKPVIVGFIPFKTQEEAEDEIDLVTYFFAEKVIRDMGLRVQDAESVSIARGDEAAAMISRYEQDDSNLH